MYHPLRPSGLTNPCSYALSSRWMHSMGFSLSKARNGAFSPVGLRGDILGSSRDTQVTPAGPQQESGNPAFQTPVRHLRGGLCHTQRLPNSSVPAFPETTGRWKCKQCPHLPVGLCCKCGFAGLSTSPRSFSHIPRHLRVQPSVRAACSLPRRSEVCYRSQERKQQTRCQLPAASCTAASVPPPRVPLQRAPRNEVHLAEELQGWQPFCKCPGHQGFQCGRDKPPPGKHKVVSLLPSTQNKTKRLQTQAEGPGPLRHS